MKHTPLKRIGKQKAAEIEATAQWRHDYLYAESEYPACELGPWFEKAGIETGCRGIASGLHERIKRSSQGSLVDPNNLVRCCFLCNQAVEWHSAVARSLGLSLRRGTDPSTIAIGESGE